MPSYKKADSNCLRLVLLLIGGFQVSDLPPIVQAFSATRLNHFRRNQQFAISFDSKRYELTRLSVAADDAAALNSFAASLEEEEDSSSSASLATASATATATRQTSRQQAAESSRNKSNQQQQQWQLDLDELMDPRTEIGRRQILLSDLLQANDKIRQAVQEAFLNGKIDPLLTPRTKQLQDGTRAVARQLTTDILPSLRSSSSSAPSSPLPFLQPPPLPIPQPEDLGKVGSRVLSALKNQVQSNWELLQSDLQNPSRIPERLSQQTEDLVKEAANVFSETPVGLEEPPYTVVATFPDYEVRDYPGYKVATTNMAKAGETYEETDNNLAQAGAAFNSLAAYLFGANQEGKAMSMTTPVQTTMSGEMRFYLAKDDDGTASWTPPHPLQQDEAANLYETGNILLQDIPPARLAVRRFTGFVTRGEIERQKQALLTALELDNEYALDVEHGQTVGHVIFQYNPPYTLPVLRRNEIAVPVVESDDAAPSIQSQWSTASAAAGSSSNDAPSDVEGGSP